MKICICSHNYPLGNGKFDKFRSGQEYNPADYDYELIDKYFKNKSPVKASTGLAWAKKEVTENGDNA